MQKQTTTNNLKSFKSVQIPILGMTCASCVNRIEKAIQKNEHIQNVSVNLASEVATVSFEKPTRTLDIVHVIESVGYQVPTEIKRFKVTGMTCASCVSHVETFLLQIPEVLEASVNLLAESAEVKILKSKVSERQIAQAVQDAGYEAIFNKTETTTTIAQDKEQQLKSEKNKIVISSILTLPLVIPMVIEIFGIQWMLNPYVQLLLATPVQFWLGARFYIGSYKAIKSGAANMDVLVALGTSAAYGLSLYLLIRSIVEHGWDQSMNSSLHGPMPQYYFESAAVVITLILLGKYLENKAKYQTTSAIRALQELRPDKATLLRNNTMMIVDINQLKLGDTVVVKPGEKISVDGKIIQGESEVDESLITGESLPVPKSVNDKVTGGSLNGHGLLHIQVTALDAETMLARIIRLVETAQSAKAPIQKLVDKVSAVFVPIVIIIAIATAIGWVLHDQNWEQALIHAVSVLVIACPCALGLATPTSIMVGTGIGAKNGILIKDAESLELAHAITTVAFDKTGTLTEGKPRVSYIQSLQQEQNKMLSIAASLQAGSEHPLAKAVLSRAQEEKLLIIPSTQVQALSGRGIEGEVSGSKYYFGSKKLMEEKGISIEAAQNDISRLESEAHTVSLLSNEKTLIGIIAFQDQIKATAKAAISELKKLNIKTIMLTGDNKGSAAAVARELGLDDFRAEVLPEHKSQIIQELKKQDQIVAMVGDGINDAPALAQADVGIAMATGTDVAMQSAGITLMRGNPLLIADAIEISKRTYSKIQQNLFWAFIYNIIGIPLASFGVLSPMLAGAAMALSSVSVVSNALLLKSWQSKILQVQNK